jgi:hypothetical protein
MTQFRTALLLASFTVFAAGCPETDGDTMDTDTMDTDDDGMEIDTSLDLADTDLHGTWVSTGDDVAPLLAAFMVDTIDATFNADGSYEVVSTDTAGTPTTFTGTYTVDSSTNPASITLEQTTPTAVTSEGIWTVDPDGVLYYEVVQTTPDQGFGAPTPETGFGGTSGPGISANSNIQVFR